MKNYGENNSNRNRNNVQFTKGDRVRFTSRDNQIHEGTIEAILYEILDEDGNLHLVDSSLVMPLQNPQGVQQVHRIPLFESVELLTGPYAGLQGILADDRTSHLTVVVEADGELKKVHVRRWEDMKLVVDRPPDTCQGCRRRRRDRSSPGDGSGPGGGPRGATFGPGIGYTHKRTRLG